jgi:LacI family transcriptional regulator
MDNTNGKRFRSARRGQGGPTIANVAAEAGVSAMTVSRVVNDESNVTTDTRDKVNAAIKALGYVPHPAARSLASGQQCRIALLHSNPSAAYMSELLVGSLAEAAACDVELTVEPFTADEAAEVLVARLSGHRIDAVLLPPPLCENPALLAALQSAGIPMAQIANGKPSPFAQAVTIDDKNAAYAMTKRLVGMGHRRIGFIIGDANQTASALRRAGHEHALAEAGIVIDPALFAQGDFTYRSGLAAAEDLLSREPRPTAIFASNDDMAAAAIAVAHRLGFDVPRDVSVCGFDDTAMATTIWPELTTVRQPIAAMARHAVQLLVEAVRGDKTACEVAARHEQLDFLLVARASDGPPTQSA